MSSTPVPKFLPFVTSSSSPEAIFKALLSRSKNADNKDLCTVFSACLRIGVDAVKTKAEVVSRNYPANDIYQEIAKEYVDCEVPSEFAKALTALYYLKHKVADPKKNVYRAAVAYNLDYSALDDKFFSPKTLEVLLSASLTSTHLENITKVKLSSSDKATAICFYNISHLLAFLAYFQDTGPLIKPMKYMHSESSSYAEYLEYCEQNELLTPMEFVDVSQ